MCYKLTTAKVLQEKEKLLTEYLDMFMNDPELMERVYYFDGFAHPNLPVVTREKPDMVQYYRWGFIPVWAKDMKTASEMSVMCLNAVSETILEKPAFRLSVENRCLVLATGFYEWQHVGKEKYPYFIHLKDKELFYMGGLYNTWTDRETGEVFNTVTILTTPANPLMETIHNTKKRMPLLLYEDMAKIWLGDLPTKDIKELMQPYDDHEMEAWTISKLITNRNANKNVPEIQARHVYPELVSMQSSLF